MKTQQDIDPVFNKIVYQICRITEVYRLTGEPPSEWEEIKSITEKFALRVGPEKDTPPESIKKPKPQGEIPEEGLLGIDLDLCTWRMPFNIKPLDDQIDHKMADKLDRKIGKLKKIRNAFAERWQDEKTGKIVAPVKAVNNLGTALLKFDLEDIADRQTSEFVRPYEEDGKRPLPEGRYE